MKNSLAVHKKIGALLFFLLLLGVFAGFRYVVSPPNVEIPPPPNTDYDSDTMWQAMSVEAVSARQQEWIGFGNRFPGREGHDRAAAAVREAYKAAGLEVLEQTTRVPVPVTRICRLREMPDLTLWPLMPNHLQPAVTPEGGLTGRLTLLTDAVVSEAQDFSGMIGVIDLAAPPERNGILWVDYVRKGVPAVVYTHSGGLNQIDWAALTDSFVSLPLAVPRLVADPAILEQMGLEATLEVDVRYENLPLTTYVGLLRAPESSGEALVLHTPYDSVSWIPDLSPGALQALGPAQHLQLLEALAGERDSLRRDVLFVATSGDFLSGSGEIRLLEALGPAGSRGDTRRELERRLERERLRAVQVQELNENLREAPVLLEVEATRQALEMLPETTRAFFDAQWRQVLSTRVFAMTESLTRAKITRDREDDRYRQILLRLPEDDPERVEAKRIREEKNERYLGVKREHEAAYRTSGVSVLTLLREQREGIDFKRIRTDFLDRLEQLKAFHAEEIQRLEEGLTLHDRLAVYRQWVLVRPALVPDRNESGDAGELGFTLGQSDGVSRGGAVLRGLMESARERAGVAGELRLFPAMRDDAHQSRMSSALAEWPRWVRLWNQFGHRAFLLGYSDRAGSYAHMASPVVEPWMTRLDSMAAGLRVTGETVLSLAAGNGRFPAPSVPSLKSYTGRVLVGNIGQSVIPSYPLEGALVGNKDEGNQQVVSARRPFFSSPLMFTTPYGEYGWPLSPAPMGTGLQGYSPHAVWTGPEGLIRYVKDESAQGQRIYKSSNLAIGFGQQGGEDVTIVLYRGSPVTILDMINPQTLKNYRSAELITRDSLSPFDESNVFTGPGELGLVTQFVDPSRPFYVTLKSGAAGNEDALVVRAFLLGVDDAFIGDPAREIDGNGYWPEDHRLFRNVAREAARSMMFLNGKRIALQDPFNMVDARTLRFQEWTERLLRDANEEELPQSQELVYERDALTYATLSHPVLRESIQEAVIGILWYLGLLVPFAFFFEKLVFGYPDVRKQLAAQFGIFLTAFLLLRLLHPAFGMIRSSLMILLGFVILLISWGITLLLMSKFQENLEKIRKQQGRVKSAEVNTGGAMIMAFMLGLNNMHRRKVRTGLTCATLVLMIFVMISFTSTQNEIVDKTRAIGRAVYTGLLVRDPELRGVTPAEVQALKAKYRDSRVVGRSFLVGVKDWQGNLHNPDLQLSSVGRENPRVTDLVSLLQLESQEPLRSEIELLGTRGWFPEPGAAAEDLPLILLPKERADEIGIQLEDISGDALPVVEVNGARYRVWNLFDSESLRKLTALDGSSLLPFDVRAMRDPLVENGLVLAGAAAPRFPAEEIAIVRAGDRLPIISAGDQVAEMRRFSVSVEFPELTYREARERVEAYLEQSGRPTAYGLDGIASIGHRARVTSVSGMVDMLIPLLIAAMTVLNTMKGSVYERRDEIYVYNAVGIAPRFVFFIFIAEAFVYAVVGSVLGYILSQGTGRILTELNMTGGLNMTYTSLTTIYASLTIAAAVFLSTLYPARAAMEIASPAEESGWSLPDPEGESIRLQLPYTFTERDRMAVLAFFHRFFLNHAEGSAGPFFCGKPSIGIARDGEGGPVPAIECPVWLKPFDLGVSQVLRIELPYDRETEEFIASLTLERSSGTLEAWVRLNHRFVSRIRTHFLHWRAVPEAQRAEMFEECRDLFPAAGPNEETAHV